MNLRERPKQLKLAIGAALVAIAFDVCALFSLKPLLGTGWLFFSMLSVFRYMLYLFFLALAYNGRTWVRYLFVGGTVLAVYSATRGGGAPFRDPFVIGYFCSAALAIGFWFSDACQSWYKDPFRVAT